MFKFFLQNTTIACLCKRALLPASSIHNHIQYYMNKTAVQLKKKSAHKFKLLYLVKEIKERKATRLSFHMLNLCPFFCGTAGPRKLSSAETYVGYTSALLYLNPQICHETMRELISILTIDRHITCFYFIQCILKENYRICRVLFSEMLNSTPVDHKS